MNNYIYCIYCRQIASRKDAWKYFQTGYYKYSYHLGTCKECGEKGFCTEDVKALKQPC